MSWIQSLFLCTFYLTILPHGKLETSLPSIMDIDQFLQTESAMISKGRDYISQERGRLKMMKRHLKEWKKWRKSYSERESEYIGVPQNIFHLFKKLTVDLDRLEKTMMENSYNNSTIPDDVQPPSEEHLKHVVMSLADQQYFYDLKPQDIMNGTLMGVQLNVSLSLDSCYFIAKTCLEFNEHLCAVDWLNTCLPLSPDDKKYRHDVYKALFPSYIFLNKTKQALTQAHNYLKEDPYNIAARDAALDLTSQLGELHGYDSLYFEANRLCRGEYNTTSVASRLNLKCRYNHDNSAFLKIAPLKEEELYDEPKILLYRDVLYDWEIEKMKAWAAKNLKIATVVGRDGKGGYKAFNYRISETGFLNNLSPEFSMLAKRVVDISEMPIESGEMWQLLSYTPGGHYVTHSDYLPKNSPNVETHGNRIISMLFYFNDVTMGGDTVFPRLKISVKPTKGTAIIWYNENADGSQNFSTDHCACPVVIGEKWGFTQWLRGKDQKCLRRIFETNSFNKSS